MPFDQKRIAAVGLAIALSGCQTPNELALKVGGPPPESEKLREVETQRFQDASAAALLASATATLQDLGYIISESSPQAGVLAAKKDRDAEEAGQVVGQLALTVAFAAMGAVYTPTWDKSQTIHVTFVVSPTNDPSTQQVRVSFDRYILNNYGALWKTELIRDQAIYKDFYDRLRKGIALEKRT